MVKWYVFIIFGICLIFSSIYFWTINEGCGYYEEHGNQTLVIDKICYPYRIFSFFLFIISIILIIIGFIFLKKQRECKVKNK